MRLLVDGSNLIHRLYHAVHADNVLPWLSRQISAVASSLNPSVIQIALDRSDGNWRREIWPNYKANRSEKPKELSQILDAAAESLMRSGWDVDAVPSYEADDVLATWSREVMAAGEQAVIVSSDRDLYQLLRHGRVTMLTRFHTWRGGLGDRYWFNHRMFAAKYMIEPQQWPEWRAMVGDKSDGLCGVAGIGDAMATKLMSRFGSLRAIADALEIGVETAMSQRQASAFQSHWRNGDLATWVRIHTLVDTVPFCAEVA